MNKSAIIFGLLDWTSKKMFHSIAAPIQRVSSSKRFPLLILPSMSAMEYAFLHSLVRQHRSSLYIEYGCGGSTLLADRFFKTIISADTDMRWCDKINTHLKNGLVRHINVGETGTWGSPKEMSEENASLIAEIHQDTLVEAKKTSNRLLILIDGRCRVLCACKIFRHLKDGDLVLVHDFTTRREYYDVLKMYDILSVCGSLVLLKKNDSAECALAAESMENFHKCDFR